ncbi:MAG: diguanylate cyclase, partial [Acidobacteria bacterium]
EFVILLPELECRENAVVVAEKIRAHLATPYLVDGVAINMTTSIGMAIYPVDAQEWGDLMRRAGSTMYCDKARAQAPSKSVLSHAPDDVTGAPSERRGSGAGRAHAPGERVELFETVASRQIRPVKYGISRITPSTPAIPVGEHHVESVGSIEK